MESLSESLHLNALYIYALDSSISISDMVLSDLFTTTLINLAALFTDNTLVEVELLG